MKCFITPKQLEQYYGMVHAIVNKNIQNNESFVLEEKIKFVYDMVLTKTKDSVLALNYAQLFPQVLERYLRLDKNKDAKQKLKEKSKNLIDQLDDFKDRFDKNDEGLNEVKKIINEFNLTKVDESFIKEYIIDKSNRKNLKNKGIPEAIIKTENIEKESKPISLLSTTTRQLNNNVYDHTEEEYGNFIKSLHIAFNNSNVTSFEELEFGGHKGFKLKMISNSKLESKYYKPSFDKIKDEEGGFTKQEIIDNGVGVFITDLDGNVLYFDKDFNVVSKEQDESKPMYYSRRIKEDSVLSVDSLTNKIKRENTGISFDEAYKRAQKIKAEEKKIKDKIQKLFENDKNTEIPLDIVSANIGFLELKSEGETNLNDLDIENSDFNYNLSFGDTSVTMNIPGTNKAILLDTLPFTEKDKNDIVELIFAKNLKKKSGLISKLINVDSQEKIHLLQQFVFTNDNFNIFPSNDLFGVSVTINKERLDLNDEANKKKLYDFFTNTRHVSQTGTVSDKYLAKTGRYNITKTAYQSGITKFEVNENNELITTKLDYIDFLKDAAVLKVTAYNKQPNSNYGDSTKPKVIKFVHSYFTYDVSEEVLDSIGEIKEETKKDIVIPKEQKRKGRERTKKTIDTTKLLRNKTHSIKADNIQIKKAKDWFDNSEISKYVSFEQLFDVVNSNAFGEFSDNAIRLYQGSNYTVLYHEAFHKFTQHFLSYDDKIKLYNETRETEAGKKALKGKENLSEYEQFLAIEELLAEDFRKYMLSDGTKVLDSTPTKNTIFRKIMNFLKKIFNKMGLSNFEISKDNYYLKELYDKLKYGKLNEYNHSFNNAYFKDSALYSSKIIPTEPGTTFDIAEQSVIKDMMDSLISEIIFENISEEGNNKLAGALFNQTELVVPYIYSEILDKFIGLETNLQEQLENATDEEAINIEKKLDFITKIIDNYGDLDKLNNGVIAYHLQKSPYYSKSLNKLQENLSTDPKEIAEKLQYDLKSNEIPFDKHISKIVNFYLSTIRQRDENGNLILNDYEIPKLMSASIVKNKLKIILENKTKKVEWIYNALQDNVKEYPWLTDLITKLGSPSEPVYSTQSLWTDFRKTFRTVTKDLYETMVVEKSDEKGNKTVETLTGEASAAFRHVEHEMDAIFQSTDGKYKINTDEGRLLNLDLLLNDFNLKKLETTRNPHELFDFYDALGLTVTRNSESLKHVFKTQKRLNQLFKKLNLYKELNIPITEIVKKLKSGHYDIVPLEQNGNKFTTRNILVEKENVLVNDLLDLEAKYSGKYNNIGLTTATGNIVYPQQQFSSLDEFIENYNMVNSFQELIEIPEMNFLNPKINPAVLESYLLKSLFIYNEELQRYDKKRDNRKLTSAHLSGTKNINIFGATDIALSSETAEIDGRGRMIQDIYLTLTLGKISTTTPASKGTTLTNTINEIEPTGKNEKAKTLYISPKYLMNDFQTNAFTFYEMFIPYLDGVLKYKNYLESNDNITKVKDYNEGKNRALSLGIFDGIFIKNKNEISKFTSLEELLTNGSDKLKDSMFQEFLSWYKKEYDYTSKVLDSSIYIDKNLKSRIKTLTDNNNLTDAQINDLVKQTYIINYQIHQVESIMLFHGNIALYKDFDKRSASLQTTGTDLRVDDSMLNFINNTTDGFIVGQPYRNKVLGNHGEKITSVVNSGVLKDVEISSNLLERNYRPVVTKMLNKKYPNNPGFVKSETERILGPYSNKNMNEADAQGLVTFDFYRILSLMNNTWSIQQNDLFNKIVNGENVLESDLIETFPPRKFLYYGPLAVTDIVAYGMHKFSLAPIIPNVTKDKNIDELHNQMMGKNISYVLFESGSKTGTILNDEGTLPSVYSNTEKREINENINFAVNPIHLSFLREVLDIAPTFKSKVIFSTQLRKLIEFGLMENGVPTDYKTDVKNPEERLKLWQNETNKEVSENYKKVQKHENLVERLVEYNKAIILNEIGSTVEDLAEGKKNFNKLIDYIKRNLDARDIEEHAVDFIRVDSNGELVYDLSFSLHHKTIERALTAIVNKRIINQKINGEALIQVATTLFEPKSATEREKNKYGQSDLRGYEFDEKTGKTKAATVKIALQGTYKNLLHLTHSDGNPVGVYKEIETTIFDGTKRKKKVYDETESLKRLNETIQNEEWRNNATNQKLISMVGVRIPVQGLNSMEFMEVWEFLPESAGSVVIPPSEIVAKSGSDFDIDKLSIMFPNIDVVNGEIILVENNEEISNASEQLQKNESLKAEINITKKEIVDIFEKRNEEIKDLGNDGLTAEQIIQISEINSTFNNTINDLKKEIRITEYELEKLTTKEELNEEEHENIESLNKKLETLNDDLYRWNQDFLETKKLFGSEIYKSKLNKITSSYEKEINDKKARVKELYKLSQSNNIKGIENSMIFNMIDILSMEQNFLPLITPNDNSILKDLADQLEFNSEYNPKTNHYGEQEDDISLSQQLSPRFNMYKHESNSIGKAVLGMGAVDNTFNTVFNSIGMYLNKSYIKTDSKGIPYSVDAIMRLKYNKLNDGISLSHLKDANGEYDIGELISQAMNGWVDVEKDSWIFNIQGNKELSPVLLFMIQAGVPIKDAVYFISNPLVLEYAQELRNNKSAYSKLSGEASIDPLFFASRASEKILKQIDPKIQKGKRFYSYAANRLKNYDGSKKINNVSIVEGVAKAKGDLYKNDYAVNGFLHFLELNELAKLTTDLKLKFTFDTQKQTSLFEIKEQEVLFNSLYDSDLFPNEKIQALKYETIIGKFNVGNFQRQIWSPLFKMRVNENIDQFLIDLFKNSEDFKKVYSDKSKFEEEFKNGFITKLFISAVNPKVELDNYKGLEVKLNDKQESSISFEGNVLFINESLLKQEYESLSYKENIYNISQIAFPEYENYLKYKLELEYLKNTTDIDLLKRSKLFQTYQTRLNNTFNIEDNNQKSKIEVDNYLSDQALNNTFNIWKLFKSKNSFAQEIIDIKNSYPELLNEYTLLDSLILDISKPLEENQNDSYKITNIKLRNNKLLPETFDLLNFEVEKLKSIDVVKVQNKTKKLQNFENKQISDKFNMFQFVGFLQSGFSTTNDLSYIKVLPQEQIATIIQEYINNNSDLFNKDKLNQLLVSYTNEFTKLHDTSNISYRKRLQEYSIIDKTKLKDKQNNTLSENIKDFVNTLIPNWINNKNNELLLVAEFQATKLLKNEESSLSERILFGVEAEKLIKQGLKGKNPFLEVTFESQIPNMLYAVISGKLAKDGISETDMFNNLFNNLINEELKSPLLIETIELEEKVLGPIIAIEETISFDSITEFTNDEKQIILEKISENHKLNIEKAKQFADELLNDDFDKGLEKLRKCYL